MTSSDSIHLSVVVPAYNESKRIPKTLRVMSDYLENQAYSYEILVVDDGSSDNTRQTVEKLKSRHVHVESYGHNRGKGYAVHYGFGLAKGEYILFADADNSTPFEQVGLMLGAAKQSDVVIGSRYMHGSTIYLRQPMVRIIGSRLLNGLVQILLLPGIPDTQCGFKLFSAASAKRIFAHQTVWSWGFDIELLYIAKRLRYKITQLPVEWRDSSGSRVQSFSVFFVAVWELVKIWVSSSFRRYQ